MNQEEGVIESEYCRPLKSVEESLAAAHRVSLVEAEANLLRIESSGDISAIGNEQDATEFLQGLSDGECNLDAFNLSDNIDCDESSRSDGANPLFPLHEVSDEDEITTSGKPQGHPCKKKKEPGTPKRPLSAYNLFFKALRAEIMQDESKKRMGFAALGQEVARKWKSLSSPQREKFIVMARHESQRYRREMAVFKAKKRGTKAETKSAPLSPSLRTHSGRQYREVLTSRPASFVTTILNMSDRIERANNLVGNTNCSGWFCLLFSTWASPLASFSLTTIFLFLLAAPSAHPTAEKPCIAPGWGHSQLEKLVSGAPTMANHAGIPRPVMKEHPSTKGLPVPPGSIITLPDEYGHARRFLVNYHAVQMPLLQATSYVDQSNLNMSRTSVVTVNTMAPFIQSAWRMPLHHSFHSRSSAYQPTMH